ncbi:hypothetical protein [Thermococcus sp. AM4]|uniref:hypothetical protein n=1 Tax=Thermococcus sp. (strain AM4) TaxID=246969 RepID=UPI0002299585|nr:hypothetical protein [Thermococcus sp. AM4]AEO13996.1 hypothetical protein TAM4_2406 [Thermococcus sp. AM4]
MKHLSFFIVFIIISTMISPNSAIASSITTIHSVPVAIWPMNENFSIVPLNAPSCYPFSTFGIATVNFTNSTDVIYAYGGGWIYAGCKNVTHPLITIKGATFYRFKGINGSPNETYIEIKGSMFIPEPYRVALGFFSTNVTFKYLQYNATHVLVEVRISNITVWPDGERILNTTDPTAIGWPKNLTLRYLVESKTGEGYILSNSTKTYIGLFPLYPSPYLDKKRYFDAILTNTEKLIEEVSENPWIVTNVIEKAKLSSTKNESLYSRLITQLAYNLTARVLYPTDSYIGLPLRIGTDYIKNGTIAVPEVTAWTGHSYIVETLAVSHRVLPYKLRLEAIKRYIYQNDSTLLKELILNSTNITRTMSPYLLYSFGRKTYGVVDVHVPPDDSMLLTLPLPPSMKKKLGASYILIKAVKGGSTQYIHVEYTPSILSPERIREDWKVIGQCSAYLRSRLVNRFLEILNNASTNGFNVTVFTGMYTFVKNQLKMCGFNESTLANGTITATSGTEMKEGKKAEKKHRWSICGPGTAILFSLLGIRLMKTKGKKQENEEVKR